MSAALQAKFHLLAILLVAFTLLAGPLFFQVRADAQNDRTQAKSTLLSKFFRENFKPNDDVEVQDYWGDYQKDNPCSGPECNPKGDLDGDGVTNEDELREGRNPDCNEDTEPYEGYCRGQDQPPGPKPEPNATKALNDELFKRDGITYSSSNPFSTSFNVPRKVPDYDRWVVSWNVTQYSGFGGYTVEIRGFDETGYCCAQDSGPGGLLGSTDSGQETITGEDVPPSGASYTISIDAGPTVEGRFDLLVRGVRDARQE